VLKKEPVSVAGIIEQATAVTGSSFEKYRLELTCDIEEGLPEIVGGKSRLEQVLINLFSNATKFTEKGYVQCKARIIKNEIVIGIKDTGVDINEADSEKIFEKSRQIGVVAKGKPKGTGLDLPICKEIVT